MRDRYRQPTTDTGTAARLGANGSPTERVDVAVVGGGVSGLVTAWELVRLRPSWSVTVLEREDHPGGTMRSQRVKGCLCEWGPNGFLTNVPDSWNLAVELGLAERLLPADDRADLRYLWVNGELKALPTSPPAFFTSDLLSVKGRLRVLLEPFMGKRTDGQDETVQSFASRRIGKEAASILVDAMVSGIYAGAPDNLSLKAAFPRMAEMEEQYGSLVRALIARKWRGAKGEKRGGGPMGPGGRLTSFDEGMEVLIRELSRQLGPRLRTGVRVVGVEPGERTGYRVVMETRETPTRLEAERVVVATPSFVSEMILKEHFPGLAWPLGQIPYAGVNVVCMIYNREQIDRRLDGFGFLVPHGQGPRMLGCIWVGSIFPPHVTRGRVLLRAMIGGARDPAGALLSEGHTVDLIHAELDRILGGIRGRPVEAALFRHAKGIPQYVPGHAARLQKIGEALAEHPGLYLAGNAYRGIGVNDCVREARTLAKTLAETKDGASAGEAESAGFAGKATT